MPEGRSGAAAIWTGRVSGGLGVIGEGRQLQTGGRYDPVTDTWTDTSIVNAPEARWKPTAVWTGNRMVVWGGTGVFGSVHFQQRCPVRSGGRLVDTHFAGQGPPDGRESHTAIWTGSADGGLGRLRLEPGCISEQRRPIQTPASDYLDTDFDDRRPIGPAEPHRDLDREPDGSLGGSRSDGTPRQRWPI